jgi:gamma-glutamyltranspeptidase/glutathione hydrolase
MTPTILLGDERVAALGSPGGSRIITMVFQGLSMLLDGSSASEAVAAPRVHHQYQPDSVATEPGALTEAESQALAVRGFTLTASERPWGNMQVVVWDRKTGIVEAASDPRWKGVGGGESRDRGMIFR